MFMPKIEEFRATGTLPAFFPGAGEGGILAGALVETISGWTRVERLEAGDRVATLDGGFCRLVALERRPAGGQTAIHVPGGVLGTCAAVDLMSGQEIFLASHIAEEVLGVGGVLVAAGLLEGRFGIARRPVCTSAESFALRFGSEEIVYANSGFLIHAGQAGAAGAGDFLRLSGARAAAMLDLIEAENPAFAVAA